MFSWSLVLAPVGRWANEEKRRATRLSFVLDARLVVLTANKCQGLTSRIMRRAEIGGVNR